MNKKLLLMITCIFSLSLLISCSTAEKKAIKLIQNGYIGEYTKPIGEAADNFFKKHKYEAFYADDGNLYVNLIGEIDTKAFKKAFTKDEFMQNLFNTKLEETVDNLIDIFKSSEFLLQFTINPDFETFTYTAFSFDGEEDTQIRGWLALMFYDFETWEWALMMS